MSQNTASVFSNPDTVAFYLFSKKPDISPIKLQKGLYFLFAYFGAFYGKTEEEDVSEGNGEKPKYLFNGSFEAWKYGPVIREVYAKYKSHYYNDEEMKKQAVKEVESHSEVKKFIDDLFGQIDGVSDFGLVDRSHIDESWSHAYEKKVSMDNDSIVKEYIEKYVV